MEERTAFTCPQRSVREDMIQHIGAINKHLKREVVEKFSNEQLLCETHPAYREDYCRALDSTLKDRKPKILKMSVE